MSIDLMITCYIVWLQHNVVYLLHTALPLVTWCNINRSGIIRARIIQELARIIANLHQNKIAKGLCFFGGITCKFLMSMVFNLVMAL